MLKRERRFDHRELLWNPFDDMLQLSLCISELFVRTRIFFISHLHVLSDTPKALVRPVTVSEAPKI